MPRQSYAERSARFDAVLEAAKARSDAEESLTVFLRDPARDGLEKILIVAALGEIEGPIGSAALREEFTEALAKLATARPSQRSQLRDLACAAVYALQERDGHAATDVFVTAAFHASRDISGYGMDALEQAGDDRAWDEVLSALGQLLSRKVTAGTLRGNQALTAIEYLARHAEPGSDRAVRLVTLVRDRWRALGVQYSVERRWPDMGPDGPEPKNVRHSSPCRAPIHPDPPADTPPLRRQQPSSAKTQTTCPSAS